MCKIAHAGQVSNDLLSAQRRERHLCSWLFFPKSAVFLQSVTDRGFFTDHLKGFGVPTIIICQKGGPQTASLHRAAKKLEMALIVFVSLCRNSLLLQTGCFISCPGGWSQVILQVKKQDGEIQGWCDYTWAAVMGPA